MSMRKASAARAIPAVLALLFPFCGSGHCQTRSNEAGHAQGYAFTRDGRQFQPSQSLVLNREKRAGVALSPSQRKERMQQMQQIDRKLAKESPVIGNGIVPGNH